MNLGQMRLEVRRAIDELTADFWTDTELNSWLNEAAKIMAANCQNVQAIFQKTLTIAQQEYDLPEDVDEIFDIFVTSSNCNQRLELIAPHKAQMGAASSGVPAYFYTRFQSVNKADHTSTGLTVSNATPGDAFEPKLMVGLFPVPSSALTLTVYYFSRHYEMKHDGSTPMIPIEFRRGLIAYATALAKEKEMAYAEADRKRQEFKDFSDRLREKVVSEGHERGFPKVQVDDFDSPKYGDIVIKFGTAS